MAPAKCGFANTTANLSKFVRGIETKRLSSGSLPCEIGPVDEGSSSKVAKATLIEFVTKLTEHTRVNQGWSGVHVIVEPMGFRELPPLGEPRHIEGNLTA